MWVFWYTIITCMTIVVDFWVLSSSLFLSVIISLKLILLVNPRSLDVTWWVQICFHYGPSCLDTKFLLIRPKIALIFFFFFEVSFIIILSHTGAWTTLKSFNLPAANPGFHFRTVSLIFKNFLVRPCCYSVKFHPVNLAANPFSLSRIFRAWFCPLVR